MKVAVFIDAENTSAAVDGEIRSVVAGLGEPIIYRLFGKFSAGHLSEWADIAALRGYEVAPQPTAVAKRGSTDIALTVHVMDALHAHVAEAICIVSADSDFVPLARRIRASGLMAVGIGKEQAPLRWREACTVFHVVGERQPAPELAARSPGVADSARVALVRLIREMAEASCDGTLLPALVAAEIQKRHPGLYDLIGGEGRFLRNLERLGIAEGIGSGSDKRLKAIPLVLRAVKTSTEGGS